MKRRCRRFGCAVERLPQEPGATERLADDVDVDGMFSWPLVLIDLVHRWWPWSRRPHWCPRCKMVVEC